MNDEEEICFKSAVRQVLTEAANDYTKENKFTPQILLKLRCVFGDTFESALELYEKKKYSSFRKAK
ncbi:hypothetical protein TSAR_001332 [Trichomalopsis sarcophagae]|uniref:Uncharacterized protein n=1 Tax=Trichomalopsis sarcophagae TaxID=543379 RepID=A0A232FJL2_9HYME|nr:hypothetical protein TSAR_001332 [Trichomalopsis sarcophagae]